MSNSSIFGRSRRFLLPALTLAAVLAWTPAVMYASGDELGQEEGFWPQLHTNVTTVNGMIVVTALRDGQANNVQWSVPLAPAAAGAVMIEHGARTTYVTVGPRQFVIDNGTGSAVEMQGGQIYRRLGPGGIQPPTPPPVSPPGESALAYESSADVAGSLKYLGTNPNEQQLLTHDRLLRNEVAAYDQLLAAIDNFETARQLNIQGRAPGTDVGAARGAMADARQNVLLAHQAVVAHSEMMNRALAAAFTASPVLTTQPVVSTERPLSPEQRLAVNQVSREISILDQEVSDIDTQIALLNQKGGDVGPRITALENRREGLQRQLVRAQADANVQRLLYRDSIDLSAADPGLQCRIARTESSLIDLDMRVQDFQRQVRWAGDQAREDHSKQYLLADTSSELLKFMHHRQAAQQELNDLLNLASSQLASHGQAPVQSGLVSCPIDNSVK